MSSKSHLDRLLGASPAASILGTTSPRDQGVTRGTLLSISIDRLMPDPGNPRQHVPTDYIEQLAGSLAENGQQQPIRVRWSDQHRLWLVIQGHCRLAAAKVAGLAALQAVVDDRVLTDDQVLTVQLVENVARRDMSDLDTARALRALIDRSGATQQQVARQLGRSPAWVCRMLQLLDLPATDQAAVATGAVTKRDARAQATGRRRGRARRGPTQIRLQAPGITVLITRTRATADLPLVACLDAVRPAAERMDGTPQRDAA